MRHCLCCSARAARGISLEEIEAETKFRPAEITEAAASLLRPLPLLMLCPPGHLQGQAEEQEQRRGQQQQQQQHEEDGRDRKAFADDLEAKLAGGWLLRVNETFCSSSDSSSSSSSKWQYIRCCPALSLAAIAEAKQQKKETKVQSKKEEAPTSAADKKILLEAALVRILKVLHSYGATNKFQKLHN